MSMPKLLQICVEGNTGSTGTIAEAIGVIALNKQWTSYIAYGRFPRRSQSNLIKIGSDFDIYLHGIETRLFDRHGLGSRNATRNLIKQIETIQPDVIHLHHLHGYYINIVLLFEYLANAGIPVVWTFHDCWSFTGHCSFFDKARCDKWKSECNNCPQIREYPQSLWLDRSKKNFYLKKELFTSVPQLTIVSVSRWLDGLVNQSFFKDTPHIVVYNGINLKTFKPSRDFAATKRKYKVEGKFLILGVATTWDRRKGLSDFTELSKRLRENDQIILVGLNYKQIKALPENIIGISRTDNKEDLVELYSASDVFLNLSEEETFGLTTVEAMACGTPVIVYNKTASPELVERETGMIIEKGDIDGLISAIDTIRQKGKKAFSGTCRKYAYDNFNFKDRFEEYFNLYNQMLRAKRLNK
jgi:glycosyltransferase involved in cell wall biosynthesis